MLTSRIPAAPTARPPVQRRCAATARIGIRVPVNRIRLSFNGLNPVSAAAAVMLAGCGVRDFTVVDPRPTTWEDAAAGAFDLLDIGMAREVSVRQRLRAANPAASARCFAAPSVSPTNAGSLIVQSAVFDDDDAVPGIVEPADQDHPMIHVHMPPGHPPGTTLLWPVRPWYARPCARCLDQVAGTSRPESSRGVRHESWPAHTALVAAALAQQILAAAGQPVEWRQHAAAPHPSLDARASQTAGQVPDIARILGGSEATVYHPGAPVSEVERRPTAEQACPLCATAWPPRS